MNTVKNIILILCVAGLCSIMVSCKKDCGMNNQHIANKVEGTWDVVEVITDTATYINTGEQFTFRKCDFPVTDCEGIFTAADGKEESFRWGASKGLFTINGFDWATDEVAKYHGYMQSINLCTRRKLVFNVVNTLTLEKAK